ncbi:MAG: DUF72 domain-containing protein [Wenzhouxiangella sp.]|nr:DUF72 domain-containing protein [Wenzhouxiangella sp.]
MTEPAGELPYRIGLPAWGFPGWQGRYFRSNLPSLAEYARVFSTVEGNTTFYRVPDQNTVARWLDAVVDRDFKFCWKLPREVTHDPRPDLDLLDQFLKRMAPLGPHNGPFLVQFPDKTGPAELDAVRRILDALPTDRRNVIEVRHPAFFESPELLDDLIAEFDLGRVCMDTRALFQGNLNHPEVRKARHEKPQVPVLPSLQNGLEFIRLVLHPDRTSNAPWIDKAAERSAAVLQRKETLYVLIHCPNNLYCPDLAVAFHEALGQKLGRKNWPPFPDWPVPQKSLF